MSSTLSNGMRWYAVQCLSNHEDKVRKYLTKYKEEDESFAKDLNEILVIIYHFYHFKILNPKT